MSKNKFYYNLDDLIIAYLNIFLPLDITSIILKYIDKYHTERDIDLATSFNDQNDIFWDDIYYMANKQMIIIHDWFTFNNFKTHLVYQYLKINRKLYINHNLLYIRDLMNNNRWDELDHLSTSDTLDIYMEDQLWEMDIFEFDVNKLKKYYIFGDYIKILNNKAYFKKMNDKILSIKL